MPRYDYEGDDDAYDEDEYYDEEYYEEEEVVQPKASGIHKPTSVAPLPSVASPVVAQPTKDAHGVAFDEFDYDILAPQLGAFRKTVGPMVPVDTLVQHLRDANYDLDDAIATHNEKKAAAKAAEGSKGLVIQSTKQTSGQGSGMGTPVPSSSTIPGSPKAAAPVASNLIVPKKSTATFAVADSAADNDGRHAVTVVITGHVDSGKSTILGHLLLQLGRFTQNDVSRNEKEGESMKKQSFKYAWLLDQSEEERRRGVTIDSGSQTFQTAAKRVSILDCPGHLDFIMNMVCSATQADAAVLVLPAQRGEFESGLQHGTREHLQVLHLLGVKTLIIVINKIDVVEGGPDAIKDRMDIMMAELQPLLEETKFAPSDIAHVIPVSGLNGINLTTTNSSELVPWYKGPSLCEAIDALPVGGRLVHAPLRISVRDVHKGVIHGRVESGSVTKGATLVFMPTNAKIPIKGISLQSATATESVTRASAGTLVELTTNADTNQVNVGDVGCDVKGDIVAVSTKFSATVQLFPGSEKAMLPGSEYSMGLQSLMTTVNVEKLVARQKEDGSWTKGMVKCISPGQQANVTMRLDAPAALELACNVKALGCFVLRQEGKTVGGGVITDILPWSRE